MQNETQYIQQDTIDIRELFAVLKRRNKLIWLTTGVITLLGVAYIFMVKPLYEVRAVMELAQIKKKSVQSTIDFKQKIEFTYGVNAKGKKSKLPKVTAVTLPKKTKNIMIIQVQGYDNDSAKAKLEEVVVYIKNLQNEELHSYTDSQEKRLDLIKKDILRNEQLSIRVEKSIEKVKENLLNISEQDAALAGIYTIEIGRKETESYKISNKIYTLKNKRNDLILSISPLHVQKTQIIGQIETLDDPIKPKKKLIVIVAFITGLMLSVFLTFFLEFISRMRKEEE